MESNPRPELCKSPALSTELRRLSSCVRESNPLERPHESRPRPPSTHGMVPPRFELGTQPSESWMIIRFTTGPALSEGFEPPVSSFVARCPGSVGRREQDGPTGGRTQMKSRAKRPCAPAPGPVFPEGVEPSASRASGERSSVELPEQGARGPRMRPRCPGATLHHPLTHMTCRSSTTTSTRSDWLAITVSMSL